MMKRDEDQSDAIQFGRFIGAMYDSASHVPTGLGTGYWVTQGTYMHIKTIIY